MISSQDMIAAYFKAQSKAPRVIPQWHFCDNQRDADECAELVLAGIKRATSPSLWWYHANQEPLPKPGDLNLVIRWNADPVCIIETVRVDIVAYQDITLEYAELEGEGDKSLDYWRRVHWPYYHRELAGTPYTPASDMPIVCEEFKVVFRAQGIR